MCKFCSTSWITVLINLCVPLLTVILQVMSKYCSFLFLIFALCVYSLLCGSLRQHKPLSILSSLTLIENKFKISWKLSESSRIKTYLHCKVSQFIPIHEEVSTSNLLIWYEEHTGSLWRWVEMKLVGKESFLPCENAFHLLHLMEELH